MYTSRGFIYKARKIAADKGMKLYGSQKDILRDIKKGNLSQVEALGELRKDKRFRLGFSKKDVRDMKKPM